MKKQVMSMFLVMLCLIMVNIIVNAENNFSYIIKYKEGTSDAVKMQIINQVNENSLAVIEPGEDVITVSTSDYNNLIQYIQINNYQNAEWIRILLQNSTSVMYIEPNYSIRIPESAVRSVDSTGVQTSPTGIMTNLSSSITYPGFPYPDDPSIGDPVSNPDSDVPIKVAVLDSGIDYTHPKLNSKTLSGYNFINHNSNVMDYLGHGTMVAGKVLNGSSLIELIPVKVINDSGIGNYQALIEGIYYAVNQGAKVINMSLGSQFHSIALQEAIEYANSQGVLLVAAVGNLGVDLPMYPAAYKEVLAVGASDNYNDKLPISNFGECLDLLALGEDVNTTYLNGQSITVSGTSFGAAIVSNAAAKLAYYNVNRPGVWIAQTLKTTADDLGKSGWDRETGFGLLDYSAASIYINMYNVTSDIGIYRYETNINSPKPGQYAKISFYIHNTGIENSHTKTISFMVNGFSQSSKYIPPLAPGETTKISFYWTPETEGNYELKGMILGVDDYSTNNRCIANCEATVQDHKEVLIRNLNAYYINDDLNVQIDFDIINKSNTNIFMPISVNYRDRVVAESSVAELQPGEALTKSYLYTFDPMVPGECVSSSIITVMTEVDGEIYNTFTNFSLTGEIEPLYSYGIHRIMANQLIKAWGCATDENGRLNSETELYAYADTIVKGTWQEDFLLGALVHGWNPDGGPAEGWLSFSASAYEHAMVLENEIIDQYRKGRKDVAYYFVGRILHLLQDMSVPSHAHADIHIDGKYEKWTGSNLNTISKLIESGLIVETQEIPKSYSLPLVNDFKNYKQSTLYKMAEISDDFDGQKSDNETLAGNIRNWTITGELLFKIFGIPVYRICSTSDWIEEDFPNVANTTLPRLSFYFYEALNYYRDLLENEQK